MIQMWRMPRCRFIASYALFLVLSYPVLAPQISDFRLWGVYLRLATLGIITAIFVTEKFEARLRKVHLSIQGIALFEVLGYCILMFITTEFKWASFVFGLT